MISMQSVTNSRDCFRQRQIAASACFAAAVVIIVQGASAALIRAQGQPPTLPVQAPSLIDQRSPQHLPAPHPPAIRQRLNSAAPMISPAPPAVTPAPIAEPPKPDWPVNDKPVPAKITWDSHGLTIDANNSSLDEIITDVAAATGAKLEGKTGDERIFGTYGPGPARDVITELLDGTAYNVLMAGDQGQGTPREIVISNRPTGPAPVNNGQNNAQEDVEYEQPQPMAPIPVMHGNFPQGMPPEQNQQMMEQRRQEMEQRQEEMRQQLEQQQQQQQQPPQ